jgi:hypothetical protein
MKMFTKFLPVLMALILSSSVLIVQAQQSSSAFKATSKAELQKADKLKLSENSNLDGVYEKGTLSQAEKEASAADFSSYNDPNVFFGASPMKGAKASVTVTIGTGTDITTGTTSTITPFKTYWMDGQDQILFTKDELNAAGLGAGDMTALAFNVGGTANAATLNEFIIST